MSSREKAIKQKRSMYLHTVMPPGISHVTNKPTKILKKSKDNAKLGGGAWQKGPFKGMPLFSLTLEERKTCPNNCHMWQQCYGNKMPFATRFSTDGIEKQIDIELQEIANKFDRFSVRLHVLGDFYSLNYVRFWETMLSKYPGLHVYGYSHRRGKINHEIDRVFKRYSKRFVIFYSSGDEQLSLTRQQSSRPVAITSLYNWGIPYCPEQEGKVASCLECGLCTNSTIKGVQFRAH